jgi:hypothetical protein
LPCFTHCLSSIWKTLSDCLLKQPFLHSFYHLRFLIEKGVAFYHIFQISYISSLASQWWFPGDSPNAINFFTPLVFLFYVMLPIWPGWILMLLIFQW